MSEPVTDLDQLLTQLDDSLATQAEREPRRADAIDRILGYERRSTQVRSLRNHETIVNFRRELIDGLIRADTARQVLRLIQQVVALL